MLFVRLTVWDNIVNNIVLIDLHLRLLHLHLLLLLNLLLLSNLPFIILPHPANLFMYPSPKPVRALQPFLPRLDLQMRPQHLEGAVGRRAVEGFAEIFRADRRGEEVGVSVAVTTPGEGGHGGGEFADPVFDSFWVVV